MICNVQQVACLKAAGYTLGAASLRRYGEATAGSVLWGRVGRGVGRRVLLFVGVEMGVGVAAGVGAAEGVAMLEGCDMPEEWMRWRASAWTSEGEDTLPPTTPAGGEKGLLVMDVGAWRRRRIFLVN